MLQPDKILLRNVVTEKAAEGTSHYNQYTFRVAPEANKIAVAQAVEKFFEVDVVKVNIVNVKPKYKRDRMRRGQMGKKSGYKKAIVTLKQGQTIDFV